VEELTLIIHRARPQADKSARAAVASTVRRIVTLVGCGVVLATPWIGSLPARAQVPAAEITISSGKEGGNYHRIATRLRTQLTIDHGSYVGIETSQGSVQNLARLEDPNSPVNVALAQADAVSRYIEVNPALEKELMLLADVGKECVILVSGPGGIESIEDLKKPGDRAVSVDSLVSGAAVTWESMARLDPAFANTQTVNTDTMESLLEIRNRPSNSKIVAVMMVQRPQTVSPPMEIVLTNPDSFRIIPIPSGSVKSANLPNGNPVYTFQEVETRFAGKSATFDTMCTHGLLIAARNKLSAKARSQLVEVLLKSRDYIAPKDP
jgi:TRAP-type uncharacterized transport system substrate-binding protein